MSKTPAKCERVINKTNKEIQNCEKEFPGKFNSKQCYDKDANNLQTFKFEKQNKNPGFLNNRSRPATVPIEMAKVQIGKKLVCFVTVKSNPHLKILHFFTSIRTFDL